MKKERFDELCLLIRRSWTRDEGVVVELATSTGIPSLQLCVGRFRNPDFVADRCVVWDGDKLAYEGAIMNTCLLALLNRRHICRCHITSVRQMGSNRKGEDMCLGSCDTCRKECSLRKASAVKVTAQATAETL